MKSLMKMNFAIVILLFSFFAVAQALAQEPSSGNAGNIATPTKGAYQAENTGGCGANSGGEGIGDDSKACTTPDCTSPAAAAPTATGPSDRTK